MFKSHIKIGQKSSGRVAISYQAFVLNKHKKGEGKWLIKENF